MADSSPVITDATPIYLVHPNALLAKDSARQLEQFGYLVETFDSLAALASACAQRCPGTIVLDVGKNMVTVEMADMLVRLRQRISCGLVVVSTRGNFESRLRAVHAGADAYFTRPLDPVQLSDRLDQLCRRSQRQPYRVVHVSGVSQRGAELCSAGFEAVTLERPAEMFNLLSDYRAELLLIDLELPSCSGIDLTRLIRQDTLYVDVPVVCMGADAGARASALSSGADDYLDSTISAKQLALALGCRAERYRALRRLILRDSLTGLYNHAAIKEYLAREMALMERTAAPLSMAIIDLDFFKKVNDTYGHPVGDQVITALARLLQQNLRRGDLIGRYGGEEFVVVMPATALDAAAAVLVDIGTAFAQLRHYADGVVFASTFSAGVAQARGHADAESLLRAADAALYQAKHAGRNRVVVAQAP